MHERLQVAKATNQKTLKKKFGLKGASPVKDIGKHKKLSRASTVWILETICDLHASGLVSENQGADPKEKAQGCTGRVIWRTGARRLWWGMEEMMHETINLTGT
jgi:hypothetical protein